MSSLLYFFNVIIFIGTYEGTFGYLYLIDDKTYERLTNLQNSLVNYMPVKGGITVKSYRWHKPKSASQKTLKRGIIDIKTILNYRGLTEYLKTQIARSIAATKEHIFNWFSLILPDF